MSMILRNPRVVIPPSKRIHNWRTLPVVSDTPRSNRLWFWTQFVIYAACTAYALDLWIIR